MVDSRVGPSRNGPCARVGHDRMVVRLPNGTRLAPTVSTCLMPKSMSEWIPCFILCEPSSSVDTRCDSSSG